MEADSQTTRVYSKELDEYVELETRLLKPVVRSGHIGRFWAQPTALVLFPHMMVDGNFRLVPESKMKQDLPNASSYLLNDKTPLSNREGGKFKGPEWYQLYPKNLNLWAQPVN